MLTYKYHEKIWNLDVFSYDYTDNLCINNEKIESQSNSQPEL